MPGKGNKPSLLGVQKGFIQGIKQIQSTLQCAAIRETASRYARNAVLPLEKRPPGYVTCLFLISLDSFRRVKLNCLSISLTSY